MTLRFYRQTTLSEHSLCHADGWFAQYQFLYEIGFLKAKLRVACPINENLVTVATFVTQHKAEMVRSALETNDIDVFLADQAISRIASHLTPMIGGIKVQVREGDVDRARRLLAELQSDPHST